MVPFLAHPVYRGRGELAHAGDRPISVIYFSKLIEFIIVCRPTTCRPIISVIGSSGDE